MRLSIDQYKHKQEDRFKKGTECQEEAILPPDICANITGGDKEYCPPLYEPKHQGFWQKANILLDNLK